MVAATKTKTTKKVVSTGDSTGPVVIIQSHGNQHGRRIAAPDKIIADFTPKSTFEMVPTDKLMIDPNYQRNLDRTRVTTIAHNWDQGKAGVLVVNQRANGNFYVIDGQHRHAAIQRIDNTPEYIFAEVFRGLTPEQEARKFYELDTQRSNLTSGQGFNALANANDPQALEIISVAEALGLTVDYNRGAVPNNLRAYKTLTDIHRRRGALGLTRILKIVSKAWPGNKNMASSQMLFGLEVFFEKYGEKVDEKHLIQVLATTDPTLVYASAHAYNTTISSKIDKAVAMVMFGLYNKNLRKNRLED